MKTTPSARVIQNCSVQNQHAGVQRLLSEEEVYQMILYAFHHNPRLSFLHGENIYMHLRSISTHCLEESKCG